MLSENVYYYEPRAYDIFSHLNGSWNDDLLIYMEDNIDEIEEYMLSELYTNYDNYLTELEDEN